MGQTSRLKIIFFGAGKIGIRWLRKSEYLGIKPEGILDNNKDLWGTVCDGVMIYNPAMIKNLCFDYLFITCSREHEIYRQLLSLGVDKNKIVIGSYNILNHLLFCAAKNIKFLDRTTDFSGQFPEHKILFDLHNGMVLGGVESWSYILAKELHEKGYGGLYLTTDAAGQAVADKTFPVHMLKYHGIAEEKDKIEMCMEKIVENLPCTIICNFPYNIFWSACMVKQQFPKLIRIIAVQHSDDSVYYEAYCLWQEYIDQCMVISSLIEQKLLSFGMRKDKIGRLEWSIPCKERIDRTGSKEDTPLRIGYAGRVTIAAKRLDLLFPLAENLKRKNVRFQIHIAGTGDYSEVLQARIQKEGLEDCMVCVGYIDRKDIPGFWSRQDIMVSCSEYEGHSISQSEAMAEGAVPVITDVSGARDDVADGYNGYVVDIGDMDALADRIRELYLDRVKLRKMGIRAHDTIYKRQKNMDQAAFWDDLIGKVWQE